MSTSNLSIQFKLRRHARWLLKASTFVAKYSRGLVRVPHPWVLAVCNRGWLMSQDGGCRWRSIRMAPDGRVIA